MKKIFLTTILLAVSVLVFAQTERNIPREDIEWIDVWGPHNNDNDLPRVLLVGDSITRQYNAGVEQNLDGVDFIGDKTQFFVNVTTEGDIIASSPCIKVAS